MSDYQLACRELRNMRIRKYAIVLSPLLLATVFLLCAVALEDPWFYLSASGCGVLCFLLQYLCRHLSHDIDELAASVSRMEYWQTKSDSNPRVRDHVRVLIAEMLYGEPEANYARLAGNGDQLSTELRNVVERPSSYPGAKAQQVCSLATRFDEEPNAPLFS